MRRRHETIAGRYMVLEAKILLTLALSGGTTGTEPREPAPPPYTYPSPAETISTPIGRVAWPVGSQDTAPVERGYWPELHLYNPMGSITPKTSPATIITSWGMGSRGRIGSRPSPGLRWHGGYGRCAGD